MTYEHMVAGIAGGLSSTLVLHPLDLLKVRFAVADGQSTLKKNYKTISNGFSTIVKEEGFKGLYKGVAPNCLGSGAAWGLYFLFYNEAKKYLIERNQKSQLGMLEHMGAGAFAGVLTTAMTNPIWVVKTRLCLQYGQITSIPACPNEVTTTIGNSVKESVLPESKQYSGTWDAFRKVYKYEGISGLYRGFVPGLFGVSHGAIQMAAYESLKKYYLTKHNLPADHKLGNWEYLSCAAISKLFAACITYPYQVVRARLQDQHVNYEGVYDVSKRTWRYESYRGFYKGFNAYLLHVMPNICIVFFVYESVSMAFK